MATEQLAIPEEWLRDVIDVIREGLNSGMCEEEVAEYLTEWCDAEEAYLDEDRRPTVDVDTKGRT